VACSVAVCRETVRQILRFGLVACSVAVCRETVRQILGFGLVGCGTVCCDIQVSGVVKQWVVVYPLLTGILARVAPALFVLLGCRADPRMNISLHVFLRSLFLHLCFVLLRHCFPCYVCTTLCILPTLLLLFAGWLCDSRICQGVPFWLGAAFKSGQ